MAKCLVTGASGFIGTHLVRALVARGDEVICLVRSTSKLAAIDHLPIRFAQGDVTDAASVAKAISDVDVVYHLAGLTKSLTREEFDRVNAGGVRNLMVAASRRTSPPLVIFVSSLAAAGPAIDGRPREPHELPRPISNYGKSKLAGEIAAVNLAGSVPLSILRPPIVIGEGDLLSLDLFTTVSRFRIHAYPGWWPCRFSVVHAADLVTAMIAAADRGRRVPGGAYKLRGEMVEALEGGGQGMYFPADPEPPSFAEFGQMIARGLGRNRVVCLPTPPLAVRASGIAGELLGRVLRRPMSLNLDKAREATAGHWICSPQTAINDLGFQPGAPLSERFRQTVEWYVKEGWL